ncbi:ATP-dependent helicase HrpB [Agarilytica rhodophyticola]|uniref:ATP-dependent helicase HrpB n=1 Tax=Agarilytica rhodophyticola TaxID=1737490 RepID=UPI000B34589C|nr:ATP-dependent helicase HrpB [Agarilytica rhodophyticola]
MKPSSAELPIHSVLADIKDTLRQRHELILQAAPGAGKTTVVPLALLDEPWLKGQQIIMLQPRRVAARATAERMAQLLGEAPGKRVGYQIRQETQVSGDTRIIVMTEGVLTRRIQADPSLSGVGLLIFDEFHERNLDADLALTLCREGRSIFREQTQPLKLLIMSATLDGMDISSFLDKAPVIASKGKNYPVEFLYSSKVVNTGNLIESISDTIYRSTQEHEGNILVFLPGVREINAVSDYISTKLPANIDIFPLHGGLNTQEQRKAIMPPTVTKDGRIKRKIVLATDIAETSLTIEGVHIVVDSGYARSPIYDPNTGLTRLRTHRISQASSIQRAGRAGRLGPGVCYRLWPQSQQHTLSEQRSPEILQTDLSALALQLLQWGVHHPDEIEWLTPPPEGTFQQAISLLASLGALQGTSALDESHTLQLSEHGKAMAILPVHPRLAHMLLTAAKHDLLKLGCDIAALLSERDTLSGVGADLAIRIDMINDIGQCPNSHKLWLTRIRKQSKQFQSLLKSITIKRPINETPETGTDLGFLLGSAFPDRIARRQEQSGSYKLSNGRSAKLFTSDSLNSVPWLVAVDLGGRREQKEDTIFLAAKIEKNLFNSHLKHVTKTEDVAKWDTKLGRFIAQTETRIGSLILRSQSLTNIEPEQIVNALIQFIRQNGLDTLSWAKRDRQWQARIQLLRVHDTSHNWPDVSNQQLLHSLDVWLRPFLSGISSLDELRRLELSPILTTMMDWTLQQQMDKLVPQTITAPSGSHIPIDYLQSPPVLSVKLQEMFGCMQTPAIINSKVPLMVHLLSPARRPVQVTQDLAGFWQNTYQQVKKELKGRYPKHPWPDDPLNAKATRFTKKHI